MYFYSVCTSEANRNFRDLKLPPRSRRELLSSGFITVRLTFLAHSVRMRPNFQGLPWFECYKLGEDELFIRFLLN
jgi:hypothetical protein